MEQRLSAMPVLRRLVDVAEREAAYARSRAAAGERLLHDQAIALEEARRRAADEHQATATYLRLRDLLAELEQQENR